MAMAKLAILNNLRVNLTSKFGELSSIGVLFRRGVLQFTLKENILT